MNVHFHINYRAEYGETLCIIADNEPFILCDENNPITLCCHGQADWETDLTLSDFMDVFRYRYALRRTDGTFLYEEGEERRLHLVSKTMNVRDYWQEKDYEQVFASKCFRDALFRRAASEYAPSPQGDNLMRFTLWAPQVLPSQGVALMGNVSELGTWEHGQIIPLSDENYPLWETEVVINEAKNIEYKYCIYDLASKQIIDFEWGENRTVFFPKTPDTLEVVNDRVFRRTQGKWRGAGVAVPLFSMRTCEGCGIGEYPDIRLMADWAAKTGMQMIQLLPINDTTLAHSDRDSYPYNAVSVFALHPIYLHVPEMGTMGPTWEKKYKSVKNKLNKLPIADYQHVYSQKEKFFLYQYKQHREECFESEQYKSFYSLNHRWLEPYAAFMHAKDGHPADYYYFLQFHADSQLRAAVAYAHEQGVAVKGDIPIGISPDSVDAASMPDLFHLDASAGAPPDDFSISGQNWGFPTYNWEVMQKDGYRWWRERFRKMEDYFDAYRIDHILGFFRIWQMRKSDVWGLCGHFSPALPYSMEELKNMGVEQDEYRLTQPFIRPLVLDKMFGEQAQEVADKFLFTNDGYTYCFREQYNTQRKIKDYFSTHPHIDAKWQEKLLLLHCEVLFVRDQRDAHLLHPRISMAQSYSFQELTEGQKRVMSTIYEDYFYHRHNAFWKESAKKKLPQLTAATSMLCCGEDLGMVPACVPELMREEQILSLEIQRMPKDPAVRFAHPERAPYLSVCTTGTHDMNPLRAWWEENQETTQYYYNDQLNRVGDAPKILSADLAEQIIRQHMQGPAMWAILPLQDWMAIDEKVRLSDTCSERINDPANPNQIWNYRMHLTIEQLAENADFIDKIRALTLLRK